MTATWVCATCGPVPAGEIRHLDHDSPHGNERHECGSSAGLDWTTDRPPNRERNTDMSTTVKARTARKAHHCDVGRHAAIAPGHRYLRHIAFPKADGNESARVQVVTECVACLEDREYAGALLIADACATFCHGDVPCARPFKHDGDHSCRRCTAS